MAQTFGGLEFQAARHRPSKEYGAFVEKFQVKRTTDDCYTPPKVYEAVLKFCRERACTPKKPPVHKLEYPVNVLTTARLRVLNSLGAVEYRLAKDQCEYVAELDNGGRIFGGGGLLLSTKAAAEREAAEREAARLASPSRVFKMELSERELQIIRDLDGLPPEPRL